MANLKKIQKSKKNRLGTPPSIDDSPNNLKAPETAPLESERSSPESRPARKTGRTKAFGTRVSPEFDQEFRRTAFEDGLKMVDLLELSFKAYKQLKDK